MTGRARVGGEVAVETLQALGADTVFGLPGQHALGIFDALQHASGLRLIGARVENNLAFAADGYARARLDADPDGPVPVTPLVISTGPGALLTLASLQESRSASVPVLAISSQVPVQGLGGGRHGYLHELPDQQASFRDVVKSVHTVRAVSQIPAALRAAWQSAATVPFGPVLVEIPQNILLAPTSLPPITSITISPMSLAPLPELLEQAATLLGEARHPVILAGGGAVRSGARAELQTLAETLQAPVVSTFGGKGAFRWNHPLSAQSWLEDAHTLDFLAKADVLLVLGSGLGELSSNYHTLTPRGRLIQIDADLYKLESNYPALGIHADVRHAVQELLELLSSRVRDVQAETAVRDLLARVQERLDAQPLQRERALLADIRAALPTGTPSYWDMTILGYWAWSAWNTDGATMHTAQGAGGLGYGLPGALGAAAATGGPVLAVSGDGGAMYGIAELASATQHQLDVTWLIVDDGGYGILRDYSTEAFSQSSATELSRPDFTQLARSFGVPATMTTLDTVTADLATCLCTPGPSVVVLPAQLRMFGPTHP